MIVQEVLPFWRKRTGQGVYQSTEAYRSFMCLSIAKDAGQLDFAQVVPTTNPCLVSKSMSGPDPKPLNG